MVGRAWIAPGIGDFEEAQVNFGEFFVIWDKLLGTFFDSRIELCDAEVGLRDLEYPRRYWPQLEPFKKR